MFNVPNLYRSVTGAFSAGASFAAYALIVDLASPLRILLGSLAVAIFGGVIAYRQSKGKPLVSTGALFLFSIAVLALYTWALLVHEKPVGTEWVAVAIIFCFPVVLLVQAVRQWRGHA